MKNATYKSVPLVVSIIGSKNRRSMYIMNVTSLDGNIIYKDTWLPTQWQWPSGLMTIEWEYHSQGLVEYPLKKVTDSMAINVYDKRNVLNISSKLINGRVVDFLQITDRYVIYVPIFLMNNLEKKFKKLEKEQQAVLFDNDDNPETIIEQTTKDYEMATKFYGSDRSVMITSNHRVNGYKEIDAITQWEQDNDEYSSYY